QSIPPPRSEYIRILGELHLLNCWHLFPHRIPLRRVNTGFKALNPLRGWEKLAEAPRLGAPSPGNKSLFVPLSNYLNGSTTASTPKPPAPSGSMGPSLPFNMEPGA
uniref:Uncharacterized protein n=1 Tax=Capra hircus TaxID=9925 RepID=A0A8C2Y487_CAPHI